MSIHGLRSLVGLSFAAGLVAVSGCASPYHADRGALIGGLGGAGAGALIGNAVGNTGAGAAIGAGLGAVTGAALGAEMDEVEARNRAMIEAQLGRQIAAGSVTIDDVIAMSQAGVDEELIVNHIRANGVARRLQSNDLIVLKNAGVPARAIAAMQEPPRQATVVREPPVIVEQAPPPVIVEEYYVAPPWPRPYYYRRHPRPCRPGVSWGFSYHD